MATTDPKLAAAIRAFFAEELMPLSRREKASGRRFLTIGSDARAATYFVRRERSTMSRKDFESPAPLTPATLPGVLTEFWTARGESDLLTFIPTLAKLAQSLRRVEEQTEDVSPFVYVMY